MEDYLEQFKPKALDPAKKAFLLGPALKELQARQEQPLRRILLENKAWSALIAASFLILFGLNAYLSAWNSSLMQQYKSSVAQLKSDSIEKLLVDVDQKAVPHYVHFQKLSQHQFNSKNMIRSCESFHKF